MHRELIGIVPAVTREEFPTLLLCMLEVECMTLRVTPEEIIVEVSGGDATYRVPRPLRV